MSKKDKEYALKEANLMRSLLHPNIISVTDTYLTKSLKLCVVMNHANGLDLYTYLRSKKSMLSEQEITSKFA